MRKIALLLFVLSANVTPALCNTGVWSDGKWAGIAATENQQTRFELHMVLSEQSNSFSIKVSLPDIGVSGWPALNVVLQDSHLSFDLPSDSGVQPVSLNIDGDTLTGSWQDNQSLSPSKLLLSKISSISVIEEKEVSISTTAGNISASILHNPKLTPTAGVIFLHGAGPQTRDANRFVASEFAQAGIVSLIFDKRGTGGSSGNLYQADFHQLAEDAIASARYLQAQHPRLAIGFWGQSQGGWIAPLAAKKWQASRFVVTVAGPAVSPAIEGEWGFIYPFTKQAKYQNIIPAIRKHIRIWHHGLRTDNWQLFQASLENNQNESWFMESGLGNLRAKPVGEFSIHYKTYMDYDPLPTLRSLNKPILMIFASHDESIDTFESINIIERLALNNTQIKLYEGYNHSMRKVASPGYPLRFPVYPADYIQSQVDFILANAHK